MPAKGHTKITERQKRVIIAAKAGGVALKTAAAQAGVHVNTALKVLRDPGTREIFREIVASLDQELQQLASLVIETLAQDLVSAQNEDTRGRLREEALKTLAHLRTLGNFGLTASAESGVGGGAKTLGDILVQVSHTTPLGTATATVAKPSFHD